MSWVSLAITAVSVGASLYTSHQTAKRQEEYLEEQEAINTEERTRNIKLTVARQKSSFLASGIALTGSGTPQALFDETYKFGLADIEQEQANFDNQIDNVWSAARSQMIQTLGSAAITVNDTGVLSGGAKTTTANTVANTGTSNFSGSFDAGGSSFGASSLNFGGD